MSEMSSTIKRGIRLKASKPLQPWNPSTSPMAKEKSTIQWLKQPPKMHPSRSGTSQAGERSSGGSPRKVKTQTPLAERQYESTRVSGSPTKRMVAPRLVKTEGIPLLDSVDTPPRTKEYFSSLLKGSGLGLSPLQIPSVAQVIPPESHIADMMLISEPTSPLCDGRRYSMDIKSLVISPSKRQKDCDEHEGPAGQEVHHPRAKDHMMLERNNIQRDGFYSMGTPNSSIADVDDEAENISAIHDAGSSLRVTEALIMKINPSIMIRKPTSRRLAIASDPVQETVPVHEESLKYQAKQYITHTLSGRSLLGDSACQKGAEPLLKDDSGRQEKIIVDQRGGSESAYQTMLKKAHFKADQASRPNPQHTMQPEYKERAREVLAFINDDLSKHKTLQGPASAPSGTDQHDIALTNSKPSKKDISSDGNEIHEAKALKQDISRQGSIMWQSPCHKSDQIHQYETPWMSARPEDTDNVAKIRERSSRQQPQPNLGIGVSSMSKNDTSKIPLDRTTFSGHSTQSIIFPDMESRPAISMPQRGQNKSVRWDPAITFIGPIVQPKDKKVTAEAKFDKLFDGGNEKAKDNEDANIDSFVETFKQWKKGDKKKLEMLLKALREIEVDSEANSTNSEKTERNQRDNAITQPKTAPLDPRVAEFSPSNLKENEAWILKPRPYVPPTQATPASSPIISASVNILSRPLQERIPKTILDDPAIVVIQDQSPLRTNILSNLGISTQIIKKRVIWDDPNAGGREAVMLSERFAAEYLEGFMKRYPLTGQKAAIMPKKRLEDLPIAKNVGNNTLKTTKMQTDAADIQQKLEVLLLKKKEAKAIKTR